MKKIITEFIKSKDTRNITLDLLEKGFDNQITDEILKEVPIIKTLSAFWNVYTSYSDKIFVKKAMAALCEIGELKSEEKESFIKELDGINSTGAEKILLAINHLETIEKCIVFGKLCKLKAEEKITLDNYHRLTKIIQDAYLPDLKLITDFKKDEGKKIDESYYFALKNLGLIYQASLEQKPIEYIPEGGNDYGTYDPEVIGGEVSYEHYLSKTGVVLLRHYQSLLS